MLPDKPLGDRQGALTSVSKLLHPLQQHLAYASRSCIPHHSLHLSLSPLLLTPLSLSLSHSLPLLITFMLIGILSFSLSLSLSFGSGPPLAL
jgi:hypothetical protein